MLVCVGRTVVTPEQVLPMEAVCAGPEDPALIPYLYHCIHHHYHHYYHYHYYHHYHHHHYYHHYDDAAVVPVPAMAGEKQTEQ